LQDHPGFREVQQGQYGIAYDQGQGGEQIVAYAPVSPAGWGVVIEEPWQEMASPYLRSTQNAPLVLVPVLLLTILALWFGARQIIRPLQELAGQAGGLATGDYRSIQEPVGGIAEIRNLQLALIEMSARVQSAQASLRRYIAAITNAQEDERRRLARELHDDTLQSVIALNQRVQLARLSLNGHPAGKSLSETQALAEQTMTNLRRLMRGLRPAYLEEVGLAAGLRMLAQEVSQSLDIPVDFQLEGIEKRLSPEVELILYRMVQEALNNVARHARATQAAVRIAFEPDKLQLEVRDNGVGFVLPETLDGFSQAGHFGLLGLYERAELASARLQVESDPGKGTRIAIELTTSSAGQGETV
jgi:signal transduction histidine kinase